MVMLFWKFSIHLASGVPSIRAALIRGVHTEVAMEGEGKRALMTQAVIPFVKLSTDLTPTEVQLLTLSLKPRSSSVTDVCLLC